MMDRDILAAKYGGQELLLRRLLAKDPDFAAICEDYCAAVEAEQHWRSRDDDRARADEYSVLAVELQSEIDARLEAARPEGREKGRGHG